MNVERDKEGRGPAEWVWREEESVAPWRWQEEGQHVSAWQEAFRAHGKITIRSSIIFV